MPLTDLIVSDGFIFHDDKKVRSIQLIANYSTVIDLVERMGLKRVGASTNIPINATTKDRATRYKVDEFKVINEVVKPINMMITRNIPLLFDYATQYKKAKGSYCLLTIDGLNKPRERDIFNYILRFINRKTFKLYSID